MNRSLKLLLFLSVLLIASSALTISTVAASDVDDAAIDVLTVDQTNANSVELTLADDVSLQSDEDNIETIFDDIDYPEDDVKDIDGEITIGDNGKSSKANLCASNVCSFTDLNNIINVRGRNSNLIDLDCDFTYNSNKDSSLKNGIEINRDLTINGNGHTLDACRAARIFRIGDYNLNVIFKNINFINGFNSNEGGAAIFGKCTSIDCLFKGNKMGFDSCGAAMYGGCAINCTFTENNIDNTLTSQGGAMYNGSAIGCTFKNNAAGKGGAIYDCYAEGCYFEGNYAGNWAGAMHGGLAKDCTFYRNRAPMSSGAIDYGDAINCTFIENKAGVGSALCDGNAIRCTFINNIAEWGGSAIQWGNATLCTFNNDTVGETNIIAPVFVYDTVKSTFSSADKFVFLLKSNAEYFNGINTTIKVFKGDELVGTYHTLTGEGWNIDLESGVYTLVLSLDEFPEVQSVNKTITVK